MGRTIFTLIAFQSGCSVGSVSVLLKLLFKDEFVTGETSTEVVPLLESDREPSALGVDVRCSPLLKEKDLAVKK